MFPTNSLLPQLGLLMFWCIMSDWKLQTHLGEKFGASVNYLDQLGKCDRIYHNYDKYVKGGLKPIWQ